MIDFVFLAIIGLFLAFGPWISIVVLFNRTKKIRFEIQSLRQELRRERTGEETAAASPAEPPTGEAAEGVPGVEAAQPEPEGERAKRQKSRRRLRPKKKLYHQALSAVRGRRQRRLARRRRSPPR